MRKSCKNNNPRTSLSIDKVERSNAPELLLDLSCARADCAAQLVHVNGAIKRTQERRWQQRAGAGRHSGPSTHQHVAVHAPQEAMQNAEDAQPACVDASARGARENVAHARARTKGRKEAKDKLKVGEQPRLRPPSSDRRLSRTCLRLHLRLRLLRPHSCPPLRLLP